MNRIQKIVCQLCMLAAVTVFLNSCETEDGRDGVDGINGENGLDGQDGADGEDFTPEPTIFENKSATAPLVAMSSQFTTYM